MLLGATALAFLVSDAMAGDPKWRQVAELQTGGEAKEVTLTGVPIERIMIRCVDGSVIINTVVVRVGEAKKSITVARRIPVHEQHVIELNERQSATGLRISDAARGRYEVFVDP